MTGPTVRVLGTHGVPAGYGGFETAAENVATGSNGGGIWLGHSAPRALRGRVH